MYMHLHGSHNASGLFTWQNASLQRCTFSRSKEQWPVVSPQPWQGFCEIHHHFCLKAEDKLDAVLQNLYLFSSPHQVECEAVCYYLRFANKSLIQGAYVGFCNSRAFIMVIKWQWSYIGPNAHNLSPQEAAN